MSSRQKAMTCRHSTGKIGNTAVFVLPTCPNMHIIKDKMVAARLHCTDCRFYEEKK